MKLAFFQGCNIPIRIEQYATAATAVLDHFGVTLEPVPEFTCCGYPVRNVDEQAYLFPSVRNLAIAEQRGLDILVICNCCFASLQKARHTVAADADRLAEYNRLLAEEGLRYQGTATVKHLFTLLHQDIGLDTITSRCAKVFEELKLSVLQGCHLIRPREITGFDDSFVPRITDALVTATGATSLDWRGKLECCGAALAGLNEELSRDLLREKVDGAREAGADFLMPVCSYCHLQLDTAQLDLEPEPAEPPLPVLLYPQLLGLCLGIDPQRLGIERNATIEPEMLQRLQQRLGPPPAKKKKKRRPAAAAAGSG